MEEAAYRMNHKRRGTMIVFNMEEFTKDMQKEGYHKREGSFKDAEKIKKTFSALGFDVKVHHNLIAADMLRTITEVDQEELLDCDCFALFILSHGEKTGEICANDAKIDFEKLIEPMRSDIFKPMFGKPKLIFIQACRGELLDSGVEVPNELELYSDDASQKEPHATFRIPSQADFYYAFATPPGHLSFRNTKHGSYFVQAIEQVFTEWGRELEFNLLMTRVNRNLALGFASRNPQMLGKKQVPSGVSSLTKELYFR